MRTEQKEAIKICNHYKNILYACNCEEGTERTGKAIETVLNLIQEQETEIEAARSITTEMNNDVKKLIDEVKKKDKIIDLILDVFFKRFTAQLVLEYGIENKEQLKQKFEQYFKRKAEQD